MSDRVNEPNDAKEVFMKCGTCSRTFGHLLDREFNNPDANQEAALDPLAGGISNEGHQCGMLWGAALAVGKESAKRQEDTGKAIAVAVTATQQVVESFVNQTDTVNCREIIGTDLNTIWGMTTYMIKTLVGGMRNSQCFNMAEQWAPKAIDTAKNGLSDQSIELTCEPTSCASLVVEKMGGSKEELVAVAGYAGGLGLSGNACGALSAAIWMKTLQWCRENPGKTPPYLNNKTNKHLLATFHEETGSETLCTQITGKRFKDINEHSEYIKNGGCSKLINVLSEAD